MLQGPGENAGVLDLGDGLAVTFKAESHNHPSAVEPFQGAGTGVGGILRDIIAMGARPIALLDALRFGAPDEHFSRAVGGIGAYGNSVGVPNVGGEVVFDDAYASNCLVNAMCVGLLPADRVMSAKADSDGALLVLYGATTGRDGIGGASVLASQELGEASAEKRPSVQVGDPFTGKRLIEVSVELVERGLVLSLQDCGAAGLASSLSEMAADYGIDVHLDRVPQREEEMEPWEVMISESQERMVAIVAPERLAEVEAVIDRWELHRAVIGDVTDTGELRALWYGDVVGAIPARHLTEECPRYVVEQAPRARRRPRSDRPRARDGRCAGRAARLRCASLACVRHPPLRPARPVPHRPAAGLDAAVLRLRPSYRGLAVTLDGTGRLGSLDPFTGGAAAIFEAARNVACAGGEPLGFTDCLNFGNPEKPEIGWELAESIEGMAQACEALGVPIVSGNVSLYNDTGGRSIPPTPPSGASVSSPTCVAFPPSGARATRSCSSPRGCRRYRARSTRRATGSSPAARHARSRTRGSPRPLSRNLHGAVHAGSRRRRRRARDRARRGRAPLRDRRPARPPTATPRRCSAKAPARRSWPSHPARSRSTRSESRSASGGSARSAATRSWACRSRATGGVGLAVCGVFGIRSVERDVARVSYFALFALQHRGQESAGIAVSEGGQLTVLRDMGLVAQVFNEQQLQALPGEVAIGHTRYSTTGGFHWSNAQPLVHHGRTRTVALGHNGNLTNTGELRDELLADGIRLGSTSDTEVIAALIARDPSPLPEAVAKTMPRLEGAYSVVALVDDTLDRVPRSARDPPLTLGRIGDDWVVASESCALDLIGATVSVTCARARFSGSTPPASTRRRRFPRGAELRASSSTSISRAPTPASAAPRSTRGATGGRAARPGGTGRGRLRDAGSRFRDACRDRLRQGLGDPVDGLIKNRYVGRTFIQPGPGATPTTGILAQVQPARRGIAGKRVVIVDDSIVRGNTMQQLVAMLVDAGAAEVHVRISSPPSSRPASTESTWRTRTSSPPRTAPSTRCESTSAPPRSTTSRSRGCSEATRCPPEPSAARASRASTRRRCRAGQPQDAVRGGRLGSLARRLAHEPLGERRAPSVGREFEQERVSEAVTVRVARLPDRDADIAVDRKGRYSASHEPGGSGLSSQSTAIASPPTTGSRNGS